MPHFSTDGYVMGIDLGPNSIGWAAIKGRKGTSPSIHLGVRVFEAGLDDLQQDGRGKSPNMKRREARQVRRRLERHTRRLIKCANALQRADLLPEGDLNDSQERHRVLQELDLSIENPYALRARALDEKLEPHELGRALFHIAQRRGFLSNRKAPPRPDEDPGKVKADIGELWQQMQDAGCRTLGELLARSMDGNGQRIRGKYTARQMYEDEFEKIWIAQSRYHECLTESLKKRVHRAIFHQRPLKVQRGLVGRCELEPKRRRAPWALLAAQRFRYLQTVNNLKVIDETSGEIRSFTTEEREALVDALEHRGDMTFGGIRRLLKLRKTKFNLELGGEKKIPGNRTAAALIKALGPERWASFSEEDREGIVEDLRSIVKDDTLKRRVISRRGLDDEAAEALLSVSLNPGYCGFSRQAIARLLPLLERGTSLQTAIKECYPDRWERSADPVDQLPPLDGSGLPELRNPIVYRTLSELRRVVNAIIKRHGKPASICIELGRDLRQTPKQRQATWKKMRANEKHREAASEKLREEVGIEDPSRDDIVKILLAEECGCECPYTGRRIKIRGLFGAHPQFDIEHIVPFDRCLDNSYMNKTLCAVDENRRVKHDRTPFEAYGGSQKYSQILERVSRFRGNARREKLRRFKMDERQMAEFLAGFTARQLNDTRWAAKWAKQYLGLLYGGIGDDGIDASGKRRIRSVTGPITAMLRSGWGLNGVLGDGPGKTRDDHRHHAVDAAVVALTDAGAVKALSLAAQRATGRLFERIDPPWPDLRDVLRAAVDEVTTSHRINGRVRGQLHLETLYGRPREDETGKPHVRKRVPLHSLSAKDVDKIVDPIVRASVQAKLSQLDIDDPKKAFADEQNLPRLEGRNDQLIPVHRVRLSQVLKTRAIGRGHRTRHVVTEKKHHMAVFALVDDDERLLKWDAEVVSMYEAHQRKGGGSPIIAREFGPETKFLFSLVKGDVIELDATEDHGSRGLYIVKKIMASKQLYFIPINDARKRAEIGQIGLTASPETLRKRNCRKVVITPLGDVRRSRN